MVFRIVHAPSQDAACEGLATKQDSAQRIFYFTNFGFPRAFELLTQKGYFTLRSPLAQRCQTGSEVNVSHQNRIMF